MRPCAYIQESRCMLINGIAVRDPLTCHCPLYRSEIITCSVCGQPIPQSPVFRENSDGTWKCLCGNCLQRE